MEIKRVTMLRLGLPIFSVLFSIAVTVGGWIMASKIQDALLREKIATLQANMSKHEMEKGEQIRMNAIRTEEHEKRIVRLEANFGIIQKSLDEMKDDLKQLLRGGNRK